MCRGGGTMERLNTVIDSVNAFAWGPPMLGILGVTGVLLTLGLVFMPWRRVGYGFQLLFDRSAPEGEGEVKPFNALMTALSATVAREHRGVATASARGQAPSSTWAYRPSAWRRSTRAVCAVHLPRGRPVGNYVGGPMYNCENGVGASPPNSASGWGWPSPLGRSRRSGSATRSRSTRWRPRWCRASGCRSGSQE